MTIGSENKFVGDGAKAWSDWVLDRSRGGTFFTDGNMNLNNEYYQCKRAYFEGYDKGKKYE